MHGLACVSHKGDQVVSGVAINIIAAGMTVVLGIAWFEQGGQTPPVSDVVRIQPLFPALQASVQTIPVVGNFIGVGLLSHNALVYLAFALVPATWWLLFRTRFGLRLRAVGENPAAVDTAGVSVKGLRFAAVGITGLLCGLAGAYMATALQAGFGREMTAGRGYIALAALIFAKWRPWHALGACMLFGFFQALALRPDVVTAVVQVKIPVPFLDALPYILTVLVLAGFVGKAIPPRAGGEPYVKER